MALNSPLSSRRLSISLLVVEWATTATTTSSDLITVENESDQKEVDSSIVFRLKLTRPYIDYINQKPLTYPLFIFPLIISSFPLVHQTCCP